MTGTMWTVWDAYCGLGGFSAGALAALAEHEATFVGVDNDKTPLATWKRNVAPFVLETRAMCKTIGSDAIDWPDEDGRLIIHWSPCCQPFSKARATTAPTSAVDGGLDQIGMILDLVIEKGYRRWSIEEVAHPKIVALVKSFQDSHPQQVAFDILDAVAYGCPSERRRIIVSSPAILKDLKGRTTIDYVSPKSALTNAGIVPASNFYRNGNVSCEPRSIARPCFTVTASHPLVWCNRDRSLVRCMTAAESAVLVGLPSKWELPNGSGAAQRATGNVVSPNLAEAIVRCALALPDIEETMVAETATMTRAEVVAIVEKAVAAARKDLWCDLKKRLKKRLREQ